MAQKIEQHTKITFPEKKMLTMSDRFHDALRSSNVSSDNVEAINSLRYKILACWYFYSIRYELILNSIVTVLQNCAELEYA